MRLEKYMELKKYTMKALADAVRLSAPTIRYILEGRDVRISTAVTIERMTQGMVTVEDLVKPEVLKRIDKHLKEDNETWEKAMKNHE